MNSMRIFSFVSVWLLTAVLAGCASVAPNTLSPQEVAGLKLTGVAVTFTPDAQIQWEDGLRLYARSKGLDYPQLGDAVESPEAKTYVRNALALKVKEAMTKGVGATLRGARAVRLDVVVNRFEISPAIQRAVLAGGYRMRADVNLVDARTGAVILAYPNVTAIVYAGNGPIGATVQAIVDASGPPPGDRVIDSFTSQYAKWLSERQS